MAFNGREVPLNASLHGFQVLFSIPLAFMDSYYEHRYVSHGLIEYVYGMLSMV